MTGWVRIDRGLWDDPMFPREPMSEREAYAWMVAQAAWEDTTHRIAGEVKDVPRGSFMTTLRELQSVFMWRSDKRVRGFLKRLEDGRTIGRTTVGPRNAPKTQITICDYDEKQGCGRATDAPRTHRGRTEDAVKEQDNNKQPSEAKASSVGCSDRDAGFDDFWSIWPNKTAKPKAKSAWRKLSIDDKRAAFSAIKRGWFDGWQARNRDASPLHPATFLNQRRWEDQPSTPQLKPIPGGKRHDKTVSAADRLIARLDGVDDQESRGPSEPLFSSGPDGDDGGSRASGLGENTIRLFSGSDFSRM